MAKNNLFFPSSPQKSYRTQHEDQFFVFHFPLVICRALISARSPAPVTNNENKRTRPSKTNFGFLRSPRRKKERKKKGKTYIPQLPPTDKQTVKSSPPPFFFPQTTRKKGFDNAREREREKKMILFPSRPFAAGRRRHHRRALSPGPNAHGLGKFSPRARHLVFIDRIRSRRLGLSAFNKCSVLVFSIVAWGGACRR